MNNPKLFLSFLFATAVFLILILQIIPNHSRHALTQGLIINNSVIQSLDGHRRYLTVKIPDTGIYRINVPTTAQCRIGDTAELRANSVDLNQATSFHYISCH